MSVDAGGLFRYSSQVVISTSTTHDNKILTFECLLKSARLLLDLLGRNEYKVKVHREVYDWVNPGQLTVTWNPDDLGTDDVTVDVKLLGYREVITPGSEEVILKHNLKS